MFFKKTITFYLETEFEEYSAREEALLDSPIVIFEMLRMVQELRTVGIELIFFFPGQAMLHRWIKQRGGGYGDVPKLVRDLTRFKDLWNGCYNVFDRMNQDDLKLNFATPSMNFDGMQRYHNINIRDGGLNQYDQTDVNKFDGYFGNVPMDSFNMILVVMSGNHLFPFR